MDILAKKDKAMARILIIIFLIISTGIITASSLYYLNFKNNTGAENHLFAIVTAGVLLTGAGIGAGFLCKQQSVKFYRNKYNEAKEWSTTFDSITDLVSIMDKDGKLEMVNKAFANAFGKQPKELIGKTCYNIVHGTNEPHPDCPSKKTLWTKKAATAEFFDAFLNKYLEVSTSPVFDDKGEIVSIVHIARDISERKRAEEDLRRKTAFLESQTEASLDGLLVVDSSGNRILTNKRLIEMWEIPPQIAEDKNDKAFLEYVTGKTKYPEEFLEKVHYIYNHQNETSRDEIELKDGRIFDRYTSPVIGKDGKCFGRIWTFRDITDKKKTEKEALMSNEFLKIATANAREMAAEAQRANMAKSEFLATMSHELRTPLNSVIGFSELLKDELTDEHKKYAEMIHGSGQQLLELISNILDFSKIEAEKTDIVPKAFRLKELIEKIETALRPIATNKGLEFAVYEKSVLPENMVTDSIRLEQCLLNLVNNAVKFTEHGHVYINISTEDRNGRCFIRFEIEDTGIGVSPEFQNKIFESFAQEDGTMSRKYSGTGLGLTISKKLAELLGGDVTLTSEKGKGSVFTLSVPVVMAEATEQEKTELKNNTAVNKQEQEQFFGKVLVAEDVRTNQTLMKSMLGKSGLQTVIAENGAEATAKVMKQDFDIIFIDMEMPGADGYKAVSILRSNRVKTPIIGMTAEATERDKEKCIQAGCDDYLTKPIVHSELIKIISKYIGAVISV